MFAWQEHTQRSEGGNEKKRKALVDWGEADTIVYGYVEFSGMNIWYPPSARYLFMEMNKPLQRVTEELKNLIATPNTIAEDLNTAKRTVRTTTETTKGKYEEEGNKDVRDAYEAYVSTKRTSWDKNKKKQLDAFMEKRSEKRYFTTDEMRPSPGVFFLPTDLDEAKTSIVNFIYNQVYDQFGHRKKEYLDHLDEDYYGGPIFNLDEEELQKTYCTEKAKRIEIIKNTILANRLIGEHAAFTGGLNPLPYHIFEPTAVLWLTDNEAVEYSWLSMGIECTPEDKHVEAFNARLNAGRFEMGTEDFKWYTLMTEFLENLDERENGSSKEDIKVSFIKKGAETIL